ncbi:tyrosine-type recombinase/integrase [Bosea vaviloviae]|uniref:tyrosine-type recombinase/integrase n=1 Tax=Bosea vaviloviae TaxID=1526658 RepID=UPI000A5E1C16|nr:tyrosine-type recombinase/integrase [Bosea vaviloviae]
MPRQRSRAAVTLPKGVHRVVSRGREYFYFQPGRGTDHAGERIPLPNDPHAPEFWNAIRQAQGMMGAVPVDTIGAVLDGYLEFIKSSGQITAGTIDQYQRSLKLARTAWGNLPAKGLRPVHVQAVMDGLAATPGKANNFLSAMRALSTWARVRDHIDHSLTEGVKPYGKESGHKPWTPEQIEAALQHLTGMIRRGVILYMYTGMRGSDAVRLGWTDVDDGGFALTTLKRKRDVWCPIVPELAAEMASWEKRPGPFLYQQGGRADGHRFTRKMFSTHFAEARDKVPALKGVTLHGLRCTAVIRLRRAGLSTGQIGDIVGMSLPMIERYCRFADRKTSGQAALLTLRRTSEEQNCKTPQNSKT